MDSGHFYQPTYSILAWYGEFTCTHTHTHTHWFSQILLSNFFQFCSALPMQYLCPHSPSRDVLGDSTYQLLLLNLWCGDVKNMCRTCKVHVKYMQGIWLYPVYSARQFRCIMLHTTSVLPSLNWRRRGNVYFRWGLWPHQSYWLHPNPTSKLKQ